MINISDTELKCISSAELENMANDAKEFSKRCRQIIHEKAKEQPEYKLSQYFNSFSLPYSTYISSAITRAISVHLGVESIPAPSAHSVFDKTYDYVLQLCVDIAKKAADRKEQLIVPVAAPTINATVLGNAIIKAYDDHVISLRHLANVLANLANPDGIMSSGTTDTHHNKLKELARIISRHLGYGTISRPIASDESKHKRVQRLYDHLLKLDIAEPSRSYCVAAAIVCHDREEELPSVVNANYIMKANDIMNEIKIARVPEYPT